MLGVVKEDHHDARSVRGDNCRKSERVGAGLLLGFVGALLGGTWWILTAVGLLPIAGGLLNFCLLVPLFHAPLRAAASHHS